MKKFLTVLLALSVVFTYSFGTVSTAFAAATPDKATLFKAEVDKVATDVATAAKMYYTQSVKQLGEHDATVSAETLAGVSKTAWAAGAAVYQADIDKKVEAKAREIKKLINATDYEKSAAIIDGYIDGTIVDNALTAQITEWFAVASGQKYTANDNVDAAVEAIPSTAAGMLAAIYADEEAAIAAARAYVEEVKTAALADLGKIDTSIYSTTVEKGKNLSSKAAAEALIEEAKENIKAVKTEDVAIGAAAPSTVTGLNKALVDIGAMGTVANGYDETKGKYVAVNAAGAEGESGYLVNFVKYFGDEHTDQVYAYGILTDAKYTDAYGVEHDLKTVAGEAGAATKLSAVKAEYRAAIQTKAAAYLNANVDATDQASIKAEADAYTKALNELVDAATSHNNSVLDTFNTVASTALPDLGAYVADTAAIAEVEVIANKYIAAGYDKDAIDEIVLNAKTAAYTVDAAWGSAAKENAINAIKAAKVTAFDTAKIDEQVSYVQQQLADIVEADDYYAPEMEKVKALYQEIETALKAAKDDDALKKVCQKYLSQTTAPTTKAGWVNPAGLNKIDKKDDVDGAFTGATWTAFMQNLSAYMNYINTGKTADKGDIRNFEAYKNADNEAMATGTQGSYAANGDYWKDFVAQKGARTVASAVALEADAKAAIDAVLTANAVDAAAKAIEAQINGLPAKATITAADAAAVIAVHDAYEKFVATYGADLIKSSAELTLKDAKKAAADAVRLDLQKKAVAYSDYKANDVADKAPIMDLVKQIADYEALRASGKVYADGTQIGSAYTGYLKAALSGIRNAAKANVEKLVNQLPVTITEKDFDKVDAAKAAYDAYVVEFTDYTITLGDYYNPTTGFNNNAAKDLAALDLELKSAVKLAAELASKAAINSVQSLKLKASSKAVKGKITVKWNVTGDASAISGYQVYKSTKANSGYKFMGKTKKVSMVNKKNLKKGKRYFYKVRAYVDVDGTRYYSDWSNKANRFAK